MKSAVRMVPRVQKKITRLTLMQESFVDFVAMEDAERKTVLESASLQLSYSSTGNGIIEIRPII